MSRFTAVLDAHRYKGEFFFPSSDGMKAGIWSQCYCGHRGRHAAHVESMLVEAGVVAVEPPDAKAPTPALIEAAYIAQDDLSKPPDQWTITAAAEIIDMYIRAQGRTKVHVLGHPAAAVRPVTPEEPR